MSTGIISATSFFENNGLFKLLQHKDGEMKKSYKTKNQEYIMSCTKCLEQVEQRGNAKFECRRCRRSVESTIDDGEIKWVIKEPTGKEKTKAEENMSRDPKILIKQEVKDHEEVEEDVEDEPIHKMPGPSDMVKFLKDTAKTTSGSRIVKRKKAEKETAEEDISEPIIPAVKTKGKKVKEPKDIPVVESCPDVEKVTMSVVRMKPGQNFYCKVTNTMYIVDTE